MGDAQYVIGDKLSRFFLSIPVPKNVAADLAKLQEGITDAQWARPEKMHITLRFLGQADEQAVRALKDDLKSLRYASFRVSLSAPGIFLPQFQLPFLGLGIEGGEYVKNLKREVDARLAIYPLPPENNMNGNYIPHVTLAEWQTHMVLRWYVFLICTEPTKASHF